MPKEDLKKIDESNPWNKERDGARGWSAVMELHNGNFHPLIWWYGRLIHLRDAPTQLANKHYNKYTGKHVRISDWTSIMERELKELGKEYKKFRARQYARKAKEGKKRETTIENKQ